jgi:hypothetical protein
MALTKISGEVIQSGINIGIVTASTINVGSAVTIHTGGFQVGGSDLHSTGITVRNVNSTGVITATSFSGNITGNINGNVNSTGVSTFTTLRVGTAVTISSGIISATSFYGDGTNLTNTGSILSAASGSQRVVLTGQTSGTMTASATSSNLTFNASTGTLSATNVSIAGTLTYEDVTNIDSIGVITARSGIQVNTGGINISAGGLQVTGVSTFAAGSSSAPSITPTGDSNTGIFFPSADTIAFAEGGSEVSRINPSGQLLVGTATTTVHAPSNLVVQRDQTWRCSSNSNVSHHRIACARYTQGQGNRLVTFNVPQTAQFGGFACFMEIFMTAHRGYIDTAQSRMGKAYYAIARQGGQNTNVVISSNVGISSYSSWNGLTSTLGSGYTPRDLITYLTLTRAGSEASTETQAVGLELAAWDNVTVVGYITAIVDITVINETGKPFTWTIT